MKENTFTLIGTYQYSSEDMIYKGKLESEGIEVFLKDSHTVDSNPLYSNALGGVKMFVKTENVLTAKNILAKISEYSLDDSGDLMKCPNCGANAIEMYTTITDFKSLLSFLFSFLVVLLPVHAKHKYICQSCQFEFTQK